MGARDQPPRLPEENKMSTANSHQVDRFSDVLVS